MIRCESLSGMFDFCVFHRDGVCLMHIPAESSERIDSNLVSGFLSAISKFGEEIEEARVKRIEFEGKMVVYEYYGDAVFAVRAAGEFQAEAERLLVELVSALGDDVREKLKSWRGDVAEFEPLKVRAMELLKRRGAGSMTERFRRVNEKLNELRDIPGVKAVALISNRGFMIASTLTPDFDEKVISAIAPSIMRMGLEGLKEMRLGRPRNVFIEGDGGVLVLTDVGERAVLLVVAKPDANIGYIFLEMDNAAKSLEKMLGGV
ncbi:MAG: roadblock/LC7 domain-containing protein [Candidatus Jordarchaeales archaeon]